MKADYRVHSVSSLPRKGAVVELRSESSPTIFFEDSNRNGQLDLADKKLFYSQKKSQRLSNDKTIVEHSNSTGYFYIAAVSSKDINQYRKIISAHFRQIQAQRAQLKNSQSQHQTPQPGFCVVQAPGTFLPIAAVQISFSLLLNHEVKPKDFWNWNTFLQNTNFGPSWSKPPLVDPKRCVEPSIHLFNYPLFGQKVELDMGIGIDVGSELTAGLKFFGLKNDQSLADVRYWPSPSSKGPAIKYHHVDMPLK